MYPAIFRGRVDRNHIDSLLPVSFCQKPLNHHFGAQWYPVSLLLMIFLHETIGGYKHWSWVPRLPFTYFYGFDACPATIGKAPWILIFTPSPDNPDHSAISQPDG